MRRLLTATLVAAGLVLAAAVPAEAAGVSVAGTLAWPGHSEAVRCVQRSTSLYICTGPLKARRGTTATASLSVFMPGNRGHAGFAYRIGARCAAQGGRVWRCLPASEARPQPGTMSDPGTRGGGRG